MVVCPLCNEDPMIGRSAILCLKCAARLTQSPYKRLRKDVEKYIKGYDNLGKTDITDYDRKFLKSCNITPYS